MVLAEAFSTKAHANIFWFCIRAQHIGSTAGTFNGLLDWL
jgi:hypothetical protein